MTKYYYVYILTNKRHTVLYTGVTSDLARRIWEHKNKTDRVSEFTKKYNCDKLVYYDYGQSVNEAIGREKQIKSWSRKRKIDLINKFNPEWKDLSEGLLGVTKQSHGLPRDPHGRPITASLGMTLIIESPVKNFNDICFPLILKLNI